MIFLKRITEVFNKVSIHPLFWLVVGIGILTGRFLEVIILFTIVFIHEMGHAVTASYFRWRIKKIELLPFGGVAEVDEYGNRPLKEELLVIISGPIQHLWLFGMFYWLFTFGLIDESTYHLCLKHNMSIFLFNLLPIWPLDGGKLVFLGMSLKFPFSLAHRYTLLSSLSMTCLFVLLSIFLFPFHLNLWIVIAFVLFTHYVEWKQRKFAHIRFLLERYYGKNREITKLKPIVVNKSDQLIDIFAHFCRGCKHQIILKINEREQKTFDENELLHAYFSEKKVNSTIGEILSY